MVHKRSVFSEWYDLSSYHFAGNGAHMEIQKTDDSYHWNLFVCTEWILFLLYDRNGCGVVFYFSHCERKES